MMTYQEIYKQVKTGQATFVDVRTKEEYDMGHIPGAILCDLQTLMEKAQDILKDQQKTYYIYCQSGNRSQFAEMQLKMMGYHKAYDIGGIIDWPFEIE
ncbi:MAG: rhodanese-like domain-containing protein [Acholeplasmataceae bacterium]